MRTGIHWKISIAFVFTPMLCFALFIPLYLKLLKSSVVPDNGVIVPLGIFGTLGLWLALTAIKSKKSHVDRLFVDNRQDIYLSDF